MHNILKDLWAVEMAHFHFATAHPWFTLGYIAIVVGLIALCWYDASKR